jgi:lysine 2,3-aminomutase
MSLKSSSKKHNTILDQIHLTQPSDAVRRVSEKYNVAITPAVIETIRTPDLTDPVAAQYVPQATELNITNDERTDPIGDNAHGPVQGIIHRYPDRCLLLPVRTCAVYCRYCFRKEDLGPASDVMRSADLEKALDYIRQTPEIWEVILSGGDPLILSPRKLGLILDALDDIPHVKVIRIHTRIPVASPEKITDELQAAISTIDTALYIAIHTNHAQELSEKAREAITSLHKSGCVLVSQSVLLKGVNDKAEVLEELFRELTALRVKPYYLHHPDKTVGTAHFRLPVTEGQKIMQELRGSLSGLAQPQYVLDIPGGHGKIPIGPNYIECQKHTHNQGSGEYTVQDPQNKLHDYTD